MATISEKLCSSPLLDKILKSWLRHWVSRLTKTTYWLLTATVHAKPAPVLTIAPFPLSLYLRP